VPSQRGLPAAQGRSLRRRGPRGFTSRCSPSRRRFRRLDTASAPRPLTNGHLLGHSQTDAAPPLSRSALRSELRPPGRAAIRVTSTSSLHLKRGTVTITRPPPQTSPSSRTRSAARVHCFVLCPSGFASSFSNAAYIYSSRLWSGNAGMSPSTHRIPPRARRLGRELNAILNSNSRLTMRFSGFAATQRISAFPSTR